MICLIESLDLTDGPNPINVILRGGWSFGDDDVLKRYLFAGKEGDQLVGRSVAGLPINSEGFAILPPHFPPEVLNSLSIDDWTLILPDYNDYPNCFKSTLPFLLASIVHHDRYLRATLSPDGNLFRGSLYSLGYLNRLRGTTLTGYGECRTANLIATGVPSHVLQAQRLVGVQDSVSRANRGIGLLKKRSRKERSISKEIRSTLRRIEASLHVNNYPAAVPVNNGLERLIEQILENQNRLFNELAELRGRAFDREVVHAQLHEFANEEPAELMPAIPEQELDVPNRNFPMYTWGGKMHLVPEGFTFPVTNIYSLWSSWYYGDEIARISPLRLLHSHEFARKTDKTNLCRARRVFNELEAIAFQEGLLRNDERMHSVGLRRSNNIAKLAYTKLCRVLYDVDEDEDINKFRIDEVTYNAIYEKIQRNK